MKSLIHYFIDRPVVVNALMFGLIFCSFIIWKKIGKEEMPEFAMNWVRVSIRFPGASAEDVELFISKPVEEKLKGVTSLDEVSSTASFGNGSFRITFEPNIDNLQEKIQEVKDAIDSVDFPREVEDPVYRQFRSSEKAIIDIGIYLQNHEILDVEAREELQKYALAFKNKLLTLPEISGVDTSGYLRPELQIKVIPEKLERYELSLSQVKEQIVSQNVRHPIGSMKDKSESEVTINSELADVASLEEVILSAGFQGQKIKLADLAQIENGFEENNTITKVQGREGIIFNVQKSSNVDILSAQKVVVNFIKSFKAHNKDSQVNFVLIDDESYDVRNRLSLIGSNGLIGFSLIVIILFLFLDFKSGVWVGMGIPFSLAFTLAMATCLGYTVNNMTLAAIIIVLGIVVDDAIIIAENITRVLKEKKDTTAWDAVFEVGAPVVASVLTTCAAFIPLYFFSGRFGLFVKYIPTVIFLMLLASFLESFFILPSHMTHPLKLEEWFKKIFSKGSGNIEKKREAITHRIESFYQKSLEKSLAYRYPILLGFVVLLVLSGYLYRYQLKYVMFPREESRDFRVKVTADEDVKRYEMAKLVRTVEDIFLNDNRGIVTSVQTSIGQNRRGGEVKENEASLRVEITPPSERDISFKKLLKQWEEEAQKISGFQEIKFQRSRFGSDSGSPIAIEIQENDDEIRKETVISLKNQLESLDYLTNVEVERPVTKNEYSLSIKKDIASRLGINYEQLSSTLRAYIEGDILYTLNSGEEEIDIRFTCRDQNKDDINKILKLTVANRENYLVPIEQLVEVTNNKKPANIQRVNYKRATMIYADIEKASSQTPLEIADRLEKEVFPHILSGKPTTNIVFRGEVEDSRESESDFALSITLVLAIIYLLLIFLFDSFWTPLLIGAIIPFGVVGTVLAFYLHGLDQYGFFAVIGTLGMIGVVINDSIVLIDKLDNTLKDSNNLFFDISSISSTRLRAIVITTVTTVAGLFPTAYGLGGYDSMLAEMMLAMGWGLLFGMFITLFLVPCLYSVYAQLKFAKFQTKGLVK
ncbi:MAG: efflux RND transporter permease subunit [Halobacteriovoraceae bacterium]|nr:efflux RND transporter permease subunit [Halobacteriovoraceae bacterium]MCB9095274.1 efflux RND transporter permease subunit [Halobacteriovoraceae bacterium]